MDETWFDKQLEYIHDKVEIEEELRLGPIPIPKSGATHFTTGQVFSMIVNPCYAGIPPYPAKIGEELWIKGISKQIERYGAELVLRVMLDTLRQVYADFDWQKLL